MSTNKVARKDASLENNFYRNVFHLYSKKFNRKLIQEKFNPTVLFRKVVTEIGKEPVPKNPFIFLTTCTPSLTQGNSDGVFPIASKDSN